MTFTVKTTDGKTYTVTNFYGNEQMLREYMESIGYNVAEVKCLTCLGERGKNYVILTNERRERGNWRDCWGTL